MLVISRKKGESILIGDNIEITIVKLDEGTAKIAIDAPKSVKILRKELYVEVEKENKEAANLNISILKKIKEKEM